MGDPSLSVRVTRGSHCVRSALALIYVHMSPSFCSICILCKTEVPHSYGQAVPRGDSPLTPPCGLKAPAKSITLATKPVGPPSALE